MPIKGDMQLNKTANRCWLGSVEKQQIVKCSCILK